MKYSRTDETATSPSYQLISRDFCQLTPLVQYGQNVASYKYFRLETENINTFLIFQTPKA